MIRSGNILACLLIAIVAATSLTACSAKKPGSDDLTESIAQTAPGYSVKNVKCESFADKTQEKGGRSSCRGSLSLSNDLYSPVSSEDVAALLVSSGIPAEGAAFFRGRHPKAVYLKSVSAGVETPFTSDCAYTGVVEGWNISCNTIFVRPVGMQMGTFGDDYVILDTPEYKALISETVRDFRQLEAAYLEVKRGIEKFFAAGRTISDGQRTISSKMVSPLVWTGPKGVLGHPGDFQIQTKYQDRRERQTSTFCGYPKGTPKDDITFEGSINFTRDNRTGQETFPAFVMYSDRSALYQNRFQSCGNRLSWDGTAFKGGYSGTALLQSQ